MRMMPRLGEERGANAVIVAILLVVLLGMLSLSVDGGFLFLKYRAIRSANDAAALAAALSCAKGDGQVTADIQADSLAEANVTNAARASDPAYDPSCDAESGTVTVHYQGAQSLFFSQVVGVGSPKTVSATAKASWGLASGAARVAPLMLSMDRLSDCNIPDGMTDDDIGRTRCSFWWDNRDLGNAAWGLMNLNLWDVSPPGDANPVDDHCNNAGESSYGNWLLYGFPGTLVLNDPPPTWACRDSGNYGSAINNDIRAVMGRTYAFPVSDPTKQLDKDGNSCPSPGCPQPEYYYIVGFAWLKLIDLCKGTGGGGWQCGNAANVTFCASYPPPDSNSRCLISEWEGFSTSGLEPGGGASFGNMIAVTLSG